MGAGAGLVAHYLMTRVMPGVELPPFLLAVIGCLLLGASRYLWIPKRMEPIVFYPDRIELPPGPEARSSVSVDYADVFSIDVLGRPGREELVIATRNRLFVFPLVSFEDPRRLLALPSVLRQRLVLRPDGPALISALEERQRVAYFAFRRAPRVTQGLLAVLVGVFMFELAASAVEQPLTMLRFGANAPILVKAGQWYRLVTGNFLHANFVHLAFNGLALYSLGGVLESVLGSSRFFLLYFAAAVGGALASALFSPGLYSVGASTAMFGLLGALLYLNLRSYNQLPTGIRQTRRFWVFILGVNFGITFLVPVVDVAGHLGGFITGVAVMAIFFATWKKQIVLPSTTFTRAGAVVLGVVTLIAAFESAQRAAQRPAGDAIALLSDLDGRPEVSPYLLNDLAMGVATAAGVDPTSLRLAERLAERAAMSMPSEPAILDTWASVRFRMGAVSEAIELEERAIAIQENPFLLAQLARFLALTPAPAEAAELKLRARRHVDGSFALLVDVLADLSDSSGWTVFAVVEGTRPVSTMRVRVGPGEKRSVEIELDRKQTALWPDDVTMTIRAVETTGCACEPSTTTVELYDFPADVAAYPGPDR
jgi:rhomboid protease GluP